MENMESIDRLREVTAHLVGTSATSADREAATDRLYDWFSDVVGLDDRRASPDNVDTELPTGIALSPALAGSCLKDPIRVSVFLRGIEAAIREAQRRFSGQRIEILYAGTGPFAPLAIPLMTRFSHEEIRFTLLDIHERSVQAVRTLVDYFGLGAYARECITADATMYVHPAAEPLHIVMGETTQRALGKEPHLAIVRNLVPQLQPNGILIPERITIGLVLADPAAEAERRSPSGIPIAKLMELTVASARSPVDELGRFAPVIVEVPEVPSIGRYSFAYTTHVDVFGPHQLNEYETGVTHPEFVFQLKPVSGQKVAFRYAMGRHPGLQWTVESSDARSRGIHPEPLARLGGGR
jgi:hypothetical protein